MSDISIRSRILHFTGEPDEQGTNVEYLDDGVLVVKDGSVVVCADASQLAKDGYDLADCEWLPNHLVMPGFIDTHVHSPQIDVIASYGAQLLDWLENYTFPAEAKFQDEAYAHRASNDFLDYSLAAGTTTSFVFTTSYKQSCDALFEAAYERDMRLVAGKVLMDQNALPALQDTAETGYQDTISLINKWHGKGRLGYAVTPRFSGTSSREQMQLAGKLVQENETLWMQTHLSENLDELKWVKKLYPEAKDYLNTYEKFGLSTNRSIFAHCIHLTDDEITRFSDTGARVAFCPTSNLFLGSGLMPIEKLKAAGIPISIATDVGGGTSLSMLTTLSEAYKVCQMQSVSFHTYSAFYMATLGNAKAVDLDHVIGNFEAGKEADFIVMDPAATPIIKRRIDQSKNIEEELFVQMMMGDDRSIERTYCHGVLQHNKNNNVSG